MTIGEFVLARSPLAKNGTYAMEDHVQAMTTYVFGVEASLKVQVVNETVTVEPVKREIVVVDAIQNVLVVDENEIINEG